MAEFPKLKTGVVAQYPAMRETEFATRVQRYVDLSEQRYRERTSSRMRWSIELSQLTDTELGTLVRFFEQQRGRFGSFDFEDPWTETVVTGCRFEQDRLPTLMNGEIDSSSEVFIVAPSSS